jgi:hypothetical protein
MMDVAAAGSSPEVPKTTDLRSVIVEFGRLLDILSAQLGTSLKEADRECVAVGQSFDKLASAKGRIDSITCNEPQQTAIRESCRVIGDSLGAAVVALQYHDRLAQRVGHIRAGLDRLHGLLLDGAPRSNDEWLELLRNVEHANRVEQQRLMEEFLHEREGDSGAETPANDKVELF